MSDPDEVTTLRQRVEALSGDLAIARDIRALADSEDRILRNYDEEIDKIREAAEQRAEAATATIANLTERASRLEDAAFHFQTCRRCRADGEFGRSTCLDGQMFGAFLRGDAALAEAPAVPAPRQGPMVLDYTNAPPHDFKPHPNGGDACTRCHVGRDQHEAEWNDGKCERTATLVPESSSSPTGAPHS